MHRGGRQRFLAARGALLEPGLLVGLLGLRPLLIPDLLDRGQDDLQGLERLDRFLIETKNEKLPPVAYFRRVAFNLAKDVLGSLRGKIHRKFNLTLTCCDGTRVRRGLKCRKLLTV